MSPLQFAGKADAYLEWAAHTGFAHFHTTDHTIGLLWQGLGTFSSTTVGKNVPVLKAAIQSPLIERAELATPVAGNDAGGNVFILGKPKQTRLILGVIDDGCPFARTGLQSHGGGSRVLLLWDQNPTRQVASGTRYGRILTEDDLQVDRGNEDQTAYERLGMKNLRRRATHGAHVLDLMAGPSPARSRVSPSRMTLEGSDGDADLPPSWERPGDAASQAPIFFVQLPKEAIEDPTGRWLGRHVLDGLDFIIANALAFWKLEKGKGKKQLVVNLSWGPQTGPHDGSSLLEQAFDHRFEFCKREGVELHLTLPAGNSHEARAHAQFNPSSGCKGLIWQAVPDARAPQFLEIWWPEGTRLEDVDITVYSPEGQLLRFKGTNPPQDWHGGLINANDNTWGITVVPHGGRFMALLALAPTRPTHRHCAPAHGRWRIDVGTASVAEDRPVHVFLARNAANMGGRRRSPDGHLHDPNYEATRHGRWPREEPKNSLVRREGTLNGIATGEKTVVAGGYVLSRNTTRDPGADPAAPYSSSGPATHRERNPDWALPSDESVFLRGVLASGVREGSAVRLTGTSTAAPQLARKLANHGVVSPAQENIGGPTQRGRRVGQGLVPMDQSPTQTAARIRKT